MNIRRILLVAAACCVPFMGAADDRVPGLLPFYGLKGDAAEIRRTVEDLARFGNTGFILYPGHPKDYLGPTMFADVAVAIDEAKKQGLEVWIADELLYPSGLAGGKLIEANPDFTRHVVLDRSLPVEGPATRAWEIPGGLGQGEKILSVVAFAEPPEKGKDPVDLTARAEQGGRRISWEAPRGRWRICWSVTRAEAPLAGWHMDNMTDVLNPEVVSTFIRLTHEAYWKHFQAEFGKTIKGFFSDETGMRNIASYDSLPGIPGMPMPWSPAFLGYFQRLKGYDPRPLLPSLWYNLGEKGRAGTFDLMDAYTRCFAETYFKAQQDWCHAHGVKLIGHVVEENHADHQLGYGAGHWFRVMQYLDYPGVDVVGYQVTPGLDAGPLRWLLKPSWSLGFNPLPRGVEWDQEFFSFGLPSMARGASVIKDSGRIFIEAFCASGANAGWRELNWVGDWTVMNGFTVVCPCGLPIRRAEDPQWRFYPVWARRFERLEKITAASTAVIDAAVLYTAESAWVGPAQNVPPVVRALEEHQITTATLPYETWAKEGSFEGGLWNYHGQQFKAVVLPHAYAVPAAVLRRLAEFAQAGGQVVIVEGWPEVSLDGREDQEVKDAIAVLRKRPNTNVVSTGLVAGTAAPAARLRVSPATTSLVLSRWRDKDGEWLFLHNRSLSDPVRARLNVPARFTRIARYDAWEDRWLTMPAVRRNGAFEVELDMPAYAMWTLRLSDRLPALRTEPAFTAAREIKGEWTVSRASGMEATSFTPVGTKSVLEDWRRWPGMESYSGTVRYSRAIQVPALAPGQAVGLDAGAVDQTAELKVNGKPAGVRLQPPYRWDITTLVHAGENRIELDVTNTEQAHHTDEFTHGDAVSGLHGPVRLLTGKRTAAE